MKRALRNRWVKALRSGKYKQGRNTLKTKDETPTYCCLGVLLEVDAPTGWLRKGETVNGGCKHRSSLKGGGDVISDGALRRLGLSGPQQSTLAMMNDGERSGDKVITEPSSFATIATWVEKNL